MEDEGVMVKSDTISTRHNVVMKIPLVFFVLFGPNVPFAILFNYTNQIQIQIITIVNKIKSRNVTWILTLNMI